MNTTTFKGKIPPSPKGKIPPSPKGRISPPSPKGKIPPSPKGKIPPSPKGRIPPSPKGRIPQSSILAKAWDDITEIEYKKMDAKTQYKILEKYIDRFKEDKYCKLVKKTQLDNMHATLYNKIMHSYIQAHMMPCIPLGNYIVDPKLLNYYPEKDRLVYIEKNYTKLDNPNTFLTQLGSDKIPQHVLKYWANNHPGDFMNIPWHSMTFQKFTDELNPELRINYLTHHSKYKSTSEWKAMFRVRFKYTNQTVIIDKPWSSITEDDFDNLSEKNQHALLEKHVQHFKDKKYCTLLWKLNPYMMSRKLLIKIINPYIKAGIQPCIALGNILWDDIVSPDLFKLYSEDDRLEYFLNQSRYNNTNQLHGLLQYLPIEKIPPRILEDMANKSPTDFINISWNNMTPAKFKTQMNPFMQFEYLKKFGPNYHTTDKYKQLYKLITNPLVLASPSYRSLKFESDVPITSSIKECLKKYSINDLVDIAVQKFGGNRNSYLKMTHDALCNLIEKKHVIIQTKNSLGNSFLDSSHHIIRNTDYSRAFKKQIKYVDSLDPKTKNSLQRYTHQFDWKVNQVLMTDKSIVSTESLIHPKATDDFDVENDLEYGYNHVFNKNITDVQRHLDIAFAHVPPLEHTQIVYRGIEYNGEKYTHDPIYNKQYISTTTKIDNAKHFLDNAKSCCILHITLPKGTRVLPLQRVTLHPNEYEVLLPRNGKLQVYKQVKNNVYARFSDNIEATKKPLRVFDEHTTDINIKLTMPKYVHSIVEGTMGPGKFNGKQYVYNNILKTVDIPYIPKKLPYIIMLKKLTKDYPEVHVMYNAITNKSDHVLNIQKGNIFEDGHLVKFTGGVGAGVVMGKEHLAIY